MTTQLLSRREDKRMYSMRADSRRSSLKALFVAQVTGVCGGGGGRLSTSSAQAIHGDKHCKGVQSSKEGACDWMQKIDSLCARCVQTLCNLDTAWQAKCGMGTVNHQQYKERCTCACILGSIRPPETSLTMWAPAATACAATSASKVSIEMGVDCSSGTSFIALHAASIMSVVCCGIESHAPPFCCEVQYHAPLFAQLLV